jgi:hypothetical protein
LAITDKETFKLWLSMDVSTRVTRKTVGTNIVHWNVIFVFTIPKRGSRKKEWVYEDSSDDDIYSHGMTTSGDFDYES